MLVLERISNKEKCLPRVCLQTVDDSRGHVMCNSALVVLCLTFDFRFNGKSNDQPFSVWCVRLFVVFDISTAIFILLEGFISYTCKVR